MVSNFQIKEQGKQILRLLDLYGPLSFRSLKEMMNPTMKEKKLHMSLSRMVKRGLLRKRLEKIFRGAGVFYQISQTPGGREQVASVLNRPSSTLVQTYFRNRDLLHTETCAIWIHRLKTVFPYAKIIRDFDFNGSPIAHEILLTKRDDRELLPDFLLHFENNPIGISVTVAVEIEKNIKTRRRLSEKLRKFSDASLLDAVIYICEADEIIQAVSRNYQTSSASKSKRIGHYGKYFLLFADELTKPMANDMQMFTANKTPVSLQKWCTELRNTELALRRDKKFEVRGNLLPSVS